MFLKCNKKVLKRVNDEDLSNYFEIEELQKLQDLFSAATGVAGLITAPDGTPLTKPSGFCDLCRKVIRGTEKGLKNCLISDSVIGSPKEDGPQIMKCFSGGLIDCGTGIFVNGKHVANWLVGQVLDENCDIENLLSYADEIGVGRDVYERELKSVKRMSLEQFENICNFLYYNAQQLSRLATQNLLLKKTSSKYKYLSFHDNLTGLYNRRYYEVMIKKIDKEENLPISIIIADVNGLKLINDAFGHESGDSLLKMVARSFKNVCRPNDISARWDGDEFVLLLPKTNSIEAEGMIEFIKEKLKYININNVNLNISFGWQTKSMNDENILEILKKAEDSLNRNKLVENEGYRCNIVNTIVKALNEKNPREEQHSKRVSDISGKIGKQLNLNDIEVSRLKVIGLLHDIGKIAIDEQILNKPGKLTGVEMEEIKKHPIIGYRILSSSKDMKELADFVLLHHERWDGNGYPHGIAGDSIPLESRIISIADSFDAMTSERTYRKPLSEEQAVQEIIKNAGTQFDPELAKVFVEKVL